MVKFISFIVLTHFFQFNELKIKATRLLTFFKLNQQYFFLQCDGYFKSRLNVNMDLLISLAQDSVLLKMYKNSEMQAHNITHTYNN